MQKMNSQVGSRLGNREDFCVISFFVAFRLPCIHVFLILWGSYIFKIRDIFPGLALLLVFPFFQMETGLFKVYLFQSLFLEPRKEAVLSLAACELKWEGEVGGPSFSLPSQKQLCQTHAGT